MVSRTPVPLAARYRSVSGPGGRFPVVGTYCLPSVPGLSGS